METPKNVVTAYCKISGLPLLSITSLIGLGQWPDIAEKFDIVHPIYAKFSSSNSNNIVKLLAQLNNICEYNAMNGWEESNNPGLIKEQALLFSAILWNLGALKVTIPSLPTKTVVFGCAERFRDLLNWYVNNTARRTSLPIYHLTHETKHWVNFSGWLDGVAEMRDEWNLVVRKKNLEEETQDAIVEIRDSAVYTKLSFKKVWNWIDIQLTDEYSAGRRETLKNIFLNGENDPYLWVPDDIDDVVEAVTKCCDGDNIVMHFIQMRCDNVRKAINNFYSGFSVIATRNDDAEGAKCYFTDTTIKNEFLETIDKELETIEVLPEKPKRSAFKSDVEFMRANAHYNLLMRQAAKKV